ARGLLGLKLEDLEDAAAGDANPADLACRPIVRHAEEGADALGWRVGDADQRAAEDVPVETYRFVEIRHRDAGMAERACSQRDLPWVRIPRRWGNHEDTTTKTQPRRHNHEGTKTRRSTKDQEIRRSSAD